MSGPGSRLALAWHYLEIEQPNKALDALDGVEESALEEADYWVIRASALAELERHEDAARAAARGLAVRPEHVVLLRLRATSMAELGWLAEAERAILQALRLSAEDPDLLCAYAELLARGDQVEKASRLVERAAALSPDHPAVTKAQMILSHLKGEDAQTTVHARALLADAPDDASRHYLMGFSLATQGRVGAASRHYSAAGEIDPGLPHIAEAAREARVTRHPLLAPLRLVHRLGPAGVWLIAMAILAALAAAGARRLLFGAMAAYIVFCVYSWVAPPAVRWWYRRRF